MITLVCCLEERSAWELLKVVIRNTFPPDVLVQPMIFEGKQDLEKRIEHRIRHWRKPDSYFLVLRDQDSADCLAIKQALCEKVRHAGKENACVIRIACKELESFYLGDLQAVETGLDVRGLCLKQKKKAFREPDRLANPKQMLRSITDGKYQPIGGSRAIAPHMNLDGENRSHSFGVLLNGLRGLASRHGKSQGKTQRLE